MFFKSNDPMKQIEKATAKGDLQGVSEILRNAVAKSGYQSDILAGLASFVSARRLPFPAFLIEYIKHNPHQIGIQLRVAELYAEMREDDLASVEARSLLTKLSKLNKASDGSQDPPFAEIAAHAYLVMSAAFTRAGARFYSKKLLEHALTFKTLSGSSRSFLQNELGNLDRELSDPANRDLDLKWQEFFASGRNARELYRHCMDNRLEILARRIDLIESQFRFKGRYTIDADEFLLEVYEVKTDDKGPIYVLQ